MDNNTPDKGWTAMQTLLDREMPEKRRRRFGWWWFSLILIPIAAFGGWQWLSSGPVDQPKQKISAHQDIANATAKEPAGINPPVQAFKTVHEPAFKALEKKPEPFRSIASRKVKQVNSSQNANLVQQENGLETLQIPVMVPSELVETELQESLESASSSIQSLNCLPIFAAPVALPEQKNIGLNLFAALPLPKPVKRNHEGKTWAFGVSSALSTEQFNSVNGFATGGVVDWKFARKVGLRMGLMYNVHTPQEKYRPVASVQSEAYSSNVDGNVILVDVITGHQVSAVGVALSDSLSGTVFIPVNRLQRLEVPVSAFWQVARPLKIFGGLSFTRTLSTTSDKQNYTDDFILKLADRSAEDDASKLSSNELDNWSTNAMFGLSFNIGRSFELGCAVKMPLQKFSGLSKADENGSSALMDNKSVDATQKQNSPVFSMYGTLFF